MTPTPIESNLQRSPVHAPHIRGMKGSRTRCADDVHANAIDILGRFVLRGKAYPVSVYTKELSRQGRGREILRRLRRRRRFMPTQIE